MEKSRLLDAMGALSSGVWLGVHRLLVPRGRAGTVSGESASALDLPLTNASLHLKALVQAGLATVEQEERCKRPRSRPVGDRARGVVHIFRRVWPYVLAGAGIGAARGG